MTIQIQIATAVHAQIIGQLAYQLEYELWGDEDVPQNQDFFVAAARNLLQPESGFWAWLATEQDGTPLGFMALNACAALYAGGAFGEISELYVVPTARSLGVGKRLIETAVSFGRQQKWPFIEVGAPSLPRWQRTADFYQKQGFREIGPRLELAL